MATNKTFNNVIYSLPDVGDSAGAWSVGAATFLKALADNSLQRTFTDSTAAPGAATANTSSGLAKFAAGASTCVITNSLVTASSVVMAALQAADGSLTTIIRVTPGSGSFTVTANAASTGTAAQFCWWVLS